MSDVREQLSDHAQRIDRLERGEQSRRDAQYIASTDRARLVGLEELFRQLTVRLEALERAAVPGLDAADKSLLIDLLNKALSDVDVLLIEVGSLKAAAATLPAVRAGLAALQERVVGELTREDRLMLVGTIHELVERVEALETARTVGGADV